jgi:hypothetical protein
MDLLPSLLAAHLMRLTIWAAVSLVGGIAGFILAKDAGLRAFFGMTAGWAAVNLIIAIASRAGAPPKGVAPFREFLWLNMGLNVAYIAVGVTMALLAGDRLGIKGSGIGVAVQGVGLLVLDGVLLGLAPKA